MTLAILGGKPVRSKLFPPYVTVGEEERVALTKVITSGVLSRYLGCWDPQFMGGSGVQATEKAWADYYGVKHALAVNSATSGLICAMGAIGLEPGDEVIVTPWSMCISATAPLFYGAIPVFADVEPDCFCLDPVSVERAISPRTKAILVVDLFGQPYNATQINAIAKKYDLYVIEDAAQAPGATYQGRFAGTLGDIGVFSLNYHKHIHCGEGGIVVTDDDVLAERISLIRNHAEAVVQNKGVTNLVNMLGQNYRMTELEAAVARCQLLKLKDLNAKRVANVACLEEGLRNIPCLTMPKVREGASHVYYVHACLYDQEKADGVPAKVFLDAVKAELPPFALRELEGTKFEAGYVAPLYNLPIFQNRIAFGSKGYPFTLADASVCYEKGTSPVCEKLHHEKLITSEFMLPCLEKEDIDDVVEAFMKVWEARNDL